MGGLLALKAAERRQISGLVLLSSELPGDVRDVTPAHLIREVPELFGPSLLGWATLPEKLQRDDRDLAAEARRNIEYFRAEIARQNPDRTQAAPNTVDATAARNAGMR